ncbi:dipeptidase [Caldivirga maquilingensis]|uniref:Peptidase M19 renal dipeptidase n=1 Tax=Caldivirga maquilingensis (strain ATCC 700844 / DSM 13496 / JCM 10307 / IC-167) TaxID=397948 RepID=A8MA16_CALMQ|nr:membrane dipeptidase [Caldivirga maquilingensis]ABW02487.1 peptidase M19 renal dipeptidase [Caldivirga maquilingensis IC-167]
MRIADLHEDISWGTSQYFNDTINGPAQSSIAQLAKFDQALVFAAIYPHVRTWNEDADKIKALYGRATNPTHFSLDLILDHLKFYYYLERRGLVKIIRDADDELSSVNFIISLEGTDALRDVYDLYILKNLGVRVIQLTWNYDTKFAASCNSRKDYGLTGEGEELVKLANDLGMLIDLAHASKQTVLDTASVSRKPIIVSHANVRKLKDSRRNLDDEMIEAVVKTGGVIGVTAIPSLLPKPSIEGVVDNIKYIGENYGWEHVAIGTDFLGMYPDEVISGLESIEKLSVLNSILGDEAEKVLWSNAYRMLKYIG